MKNIILLGSTGSIGTQVADVLRRHRGRFRLVALAGHSNLGVMQSQIREFSPRLAAVGDRNAAGKLKEWCSANHMRTEVLSGPEGLIEAASYQPADLVVSSVVGSIGIEPLMAAIRSKKDVALANKEALVVAGELIMAEARRCGVRILPVDSEHSAIFQCLKNEDRRQVKRLLLTASGGPFYRSTKKASSISVADALAHPTWVMGRKITIDSATLMNKGLEAIEAHHLFGLRMEQIEIVIHPQSIVHSLVEFVDGTVLAQLSKPDMRLPIQYALTYPRRYPSAVETLDLAAVGHLEFAKPDFRRFPCLGLALEAGRAGGTMPAAMNAANEVAVESFLAGKIGFSSIPEVIARVMKTHRAHPRPGLKKLLETDRAARSTAGELVGKLK
ncbi:MAG: 1-deoxy-D-xylulose-5-phosphate reductoisomerase [Endomicrobiales bacterium]